MSVALWRIATEAPDYGASDLRGLGAMGTGGRRNSRGTPVVHSSTNIALALIETLLSRRYNSMSYNRYLVRIEVPESVWAAKKIMDPAPGGWDAIPIGLSSRTAGDDWNTSRTSAILLVPSVIVPDESNALINPMHPDAAAITATTVRRWSYDPRFFS